ATAPKWRATCRFSAKRTGSRTTCASRNVLPRSSGPEGAAMSSDGYEFAERAGTSPNSPVIFLFHGTGGDEHQFLELAAQLLPGARRVAPRGDVSEGGAARYFRRLAEGRYDMADLARAT